MFVAAHRRQHGSTTLQVVEGTHPGFRRVVFVLPSVVMKHAHA